ncbi:MAG: hypothetical protein HY898_22265 [Deltaproteobacteria bacterium]|nr:hypothetical protein [Deltaproteobacteria bacterium]
MLSRSSGVLLRGRRVQRTCLAFHLLVLASLSGCRPNGGHAPVPASGEYFPGSELPAALGASYGQVLRDLGEPGLAQERRAFVRVLFVPAMTRHFFVVRLVADTQDAVSATVVATEAESCIVGDRFGTTETRTLVISRSTRAVQASVLERIGQCLESGGLRTLLRDPTRAVADEEIWLLELTTSTGRTVLLSSTVDQPVTGIQPCFASVLQAGFPELDIADVLHYPFTKAAAEAYRDGGVIAPRRPCDALSGSRR